MNIVVYFQNGKRTFEIGTTLGDGSTRYGLRPLEARDDAIFFAEALMLGYKPAGQQLSDPFSTWQRNGKRRTEKDADGQRFSERIGLGPASGI